MAHSSCGTDLQDKLSNSEEMAQPHKPESYLSNDETISTEHIHKLAYQSSHTIQVDTSTYGTLHNNLSRCSILHHQRQTTTTAQTSH